MRNVERGGMGITADTHVWAEHYAGCGCDPEAEQRQHEAEVLALVEREDRIRAESMNGAHP